MTWQRSEEIANQLRQRVTAGLHFGLVEPGERLPSARAIARHYGVHQRVVVEAFHLLEREGVIALRPRSGAYVAEPPAGMRCPERAAWAAALLADGVARGIAVPDLADHLRRHAQTRRLRAACVECNADQLALIGDELQSDYGIDADGVELDALDHREASATLGAADLVVTTSLHEHPVRRAAAHAGRPCIVISLRRELVRDIRRLLRQGTVYVIATDPRFAAKLREMVPSAAGGRRLKTLIVGRDEIRVPDDAPVYVMNRARPSLAGSPLLERARPLEHVFSARSSREIVDFLVRENARAASASPARAVSAAAAAPIHRPAPAVHPG